MKTHEECKGCSYMVTPIKCIIKYNNIYIKSCPCVVCIIKAMCTDMCMERCQLFTDLSHDTRFRYL